MIEHYWRSLEYKILPTREDTETLILNAHQKHLQPHETIFAAIEPVWFAFPNLPPKIDLFKAAQQTQSEIVANSMV